MASPSTPAPAQAPTPKEPKIVQRLALRTLVLVVLLGGGFLGLRWYQNNRADPNADQKADTVGMISAVQYHDDGGSEVVAFRADNSVVQSGGYRPGATDRDPVWSPDGNFVFFVSDRAENTFHVYRWNPETKLAEVRTVGKQSRTYPSFSPFAAPGDNTLLLTSGGYIMQLDPNSTGVTRVLPPISKDITQTGSPEEGGMEGQLGALYGAIGNSFKYGQWINGGKAIAAVMTRENGEALLVQSMTADNGQFPPPEVLVAGDKVDFAVNPKTGGIAFTVLGFQWPGTPPAAAIKNGKVKTPYRSALGFWNPDGSSDLIAVAPDNSQAFTSPAVNSDGDTVVACVGPYNGNGSLDSKGAVAFPIKPHGAAQGHIVARGEVFEPSWDASGTQIAFIRRTTDGKRTIFTVHSDGSSERDVSGSNGNFGYPRFSPQTTKQ